MIKLIRNFIKEEDGLELSEYALMGALIVIALVAAVTGLQTAIGGSFGRIAGVVSGAS